MEAKADGEDSIQAQTKGSLTLVWEVKVLAKRQVVMASGPPSTFSCSPARSDASLPNMQAPVITNPSDAQAPMMCAPQPQHPQVRFETWVAGEQDVVEKMHVQHHVAGNVMHVDDHQQMVVLPIELELEGGYAGPYDVYAGTEIAGLEMEMDIAAAEYGYCAPQEF